MDMRYLTFLILLVIFCFGTEEVAARGGRAGGGGGGGNSGGSKGGSSSSDNGGKGGGSRKYAAVLAAGYTVSGLPRYRARYFGTEGYSSDPAVCYTEEPGILDNGNETSSLGYFVCPYEETDEITDTHCCGSELSQRCCGFWGSDARRGGIIFGIIIGVVIFVGAAVGLIVYFCRK